MQQRIPFVLDQQLTIQKNVPPRKRNNTFTLYCCWATEYFNSVQLCSCSCKVSDKLHDFNKIRVFSADWNGSLKHQILSKSAQWDPYRRTRADGLHEVNGRFLRLSRTRLKTKFVTRQNDVHTYGKRFLCLCLTFKGPLTVPKGAGAYSQAWRNVIPYCYQYFVFTVTTGTTQTDITHKLRVLWEPRQGSRYKLEGPGIESRWRRDFPHLSRPALRPTQPSYTTGTESFSGVKRPGSGVDHPPHLAPRLKKE
jgi:hypothetical protein